MKFERIVLFDPAFDKRNDDPKKNYGIGSVRMTMVLRKGSRAIQFMVFTNWNLPHVEEEFRLKPRDYAPMYAADLG
jgi:hypothetical protein